jgi:Ca2+-binding RTX toxin-like protein
MVTFNFSYAPGTTLQQMMGFEMAGRIWSTYLTDNVTVNLHVEMTDRLGANTLGGSIPRLNAKQDFKPFRDSLFADSVSADDRLAMNAVNDKEIDAWFDLYEGGNGNSGSSLHTNRMNITSANSKALGITLKKGTSDQLDGYILMNKLANQSAQWNYDYGRSSQAPTNSVDFLSTILHEMGHVLGFASSVDRSGWVNSRVRSNDERKNYESNIKERIQHATPLDLFRYSTESGSNRDFSVGGNIFLSLNQGQQSLASFSSGKDTTAGGDGSQSSHWKGTPGSTGIMDPSLGLAERASIAAIDLRVLDVIGWNLSPQGINTALNLSTLQDQSKQALAQRLGKTVAWIDANSTLASQQLSRNLTQDVLTLIENSEVYDKGRRPPNDPFGQILEVLSLEGVFEEWMSEDAMKVGDRHQNQIFGSAQTDLISGMAGSDHLVGNGGKDLIEGGKGRDVLSGGNGNDVLTGGRQCDRLMGGKGRDVFVLQPIGGCDVIQDFQDGKDQLGLAPSLQVEKLGISQVGKNTLIVWEGEAIALLKGISANQISAVDFMAA